VSLKFDAGLTELCVLVIRRESDVNLTSELQDLTIVRFFITANYCVVLFAVRYSSNPLSNKCHFGHVGGADLNLMFVLQRKTPVFVLKSRKRRDKLSNPNMLTLREIMTDGQFESESRVALKNLTSFSATPLLRMI